MFLSPTQIDEMHQLDFVGPRFIKIYGPISSLNLIYVRSNKVHIELERLTPQITQNLAHGPGVPEEEIELYRKEHQNQSDASMGRSQKGTIYARVITPGFWIAMILCIY
jgi:hypothetical protein